MPQVATPAGLLEPHKIQAALAESILLETPSIPDYRLVVELMLLVVSGLVVAALINYLGITLGLTLVTIYKTAISYLGLYLISQNLLIDVTWTLASQQFYLNFRKQYKLRQQIKKQFEHYLDPRQVKRLQSNPELLKLGGEKRRCTFLFTDVRGFTSLSEQLPPEQVTEIMNKALTIQANAVKANDGMVDKYIGDAMMAIFNAPIDLDNHEDRAIRTATQILHDMQEAKLGVEIGIGINTGEAVVGKEVKKDLVIGEQTALGSSYKLNKLPSIKVKGKAKAIKIFTLPLDKSVKK
jgi:adenylate cyclase